MGNASMSIIKVTWLKKISLLFMIYFFGLIVCALHLRCWLDGWKRVFCALCSLDVGLTVIDYPISTTICSFWCALCFALCLGWTSPICSFWDVIPFCKLFFSMLLGSFGYLALADGHITQQQLQPWMHLFESIHFCPTCKVLISSKGLHSQWHSWSGLIIS